jgi:hypothetical protein
MRRAACATALTLLAILIAQALHVARAHADGADDTERGDARTPAPDGSGTPAAASTLVIPPPPSRIAPRLAVEVHTGLTLPLDNSALCPREHGCVMQPGGGFGVSLERRYLSGFGGLVAYDTWFLDSDSVYELAVQQLLRTGVRYTMPTDYIFHPIFELSLGVMGLGDTFRIATVGVLGQAFAGAEIELTETFGLRLGIGMRAFSHSPFRTQRDDVPRGEDGVFSEAFFGEVGFTLM